MKPVKPIHYEPHPVSPERKAELVAKGVTIIDVIFKPKDEPAAPLLDDAAKAEAEEAAKRAAEEAEQQRLADEEEAKKKALEDADANDDGRVTVAELKAALAERGIEFKPNAKKAELQKLLDDAAKA